ncbi:unnamed protein product [Symbiodinium necroappetens]|uniref:Uncharacterized protein n=1 Tax=Symbiodinium necroappetens TaxID=1628268 RepID=A0A812KCS2_9DINO|nr:unnamed protein product [Symbiodinium necroappetens]
MNGVEESWKQVSMKDTAGKEHEKLEDTTGTCELQDLAKARLVGALEWSATRTPKPLKEHALHQEWTAWRAKLPRSWAASAKIAREDASMRNCTSQDGFDDADFDKAHFVGADLTLDKLDACRRLKVDSTFVHRLWTALDPPIANLAMHPPAKDMRGRSAQPGRNGLGAVAWRAERDGWQCG